MSDGSNAANMSLAPGVLDTIIALAATEVKGVAAVEAPEEPEAPAEEEPEPTIWDRFTALFA